MEADPKVYVGVKAQFKPDGKLLPFSIIWENGKEFEIDHIVDVRRAASLKAGGAGYVQQKIMQSCALQFTYTRMISV